MKKLAIVTTHPIQYYAPVFKLLHQRRNIDIKVFYTLGNAQPKHDPGFGKIISWDIPLLEGYPYQWGRNISTQPGSHHFKGIVTPELIGTIEAWRPDAILVFGWAYNSHLKIIRYFKNKVPLYFRGDSTLLNDISGVQRLAKNIFLKWVYSHISHAFYAGVNNKAYFKKYGLKEAQLSFAPHAVDNERFNADRGAEAAGLRASLGIDKDDILILYAGKFEPVKNLHSLVNAFGTFENPAVHLLLAGSGTDEEELKRLAANSTAGRRIHFTGFKNQTYMPVLYQAADVFCLPSKSETWGLAINEAMACGRAILASDKVGCVADLVNHNVNGVVFKSGDANDLAEKLQALTANKAELIRMGQESQLIIKNYSFLHIAEAIENKVQHETH